MKKPLSELWQRHQTDVRSGVDSSAWDATWIRDPCRSRVSCDHIHACVCGGGSCARAANRPTTESVSSPRTRLTGLFRTPLRNPEILTASMLLRSRMCDQSHVILFLDVDLFTISTSIRTGFTQVSDSSGGCSLNKTGNERLSRGLDRETVCGTFSLS